MSPDDEKSSEAAERLAYLERIAQKCAGDSRVLDIDTLKRLAETSGGALAAARPADESSQGSDSDRVDDKFSVEPVHENITRKLRKWKTSFRFVCSSFDRLLWGIFALELFHAH